MGGQSSPYHQALKARVKTYDGRLRKCTKHTVGGVHRGQKGGGWNLTYNSVMLSTCVVQRALHIYTIRLKFTKLPISIITDIKIYILVFMCDYFYMILYFEI